MIILISGLSGTGKTTLGKLLSEFIPDSSFTDLDWFYHKDKPTFRLSSGKVLKNWDAVASIDWQKFNEHVLNLQTSTKIVVGFVLPQELLKFKSDKHFHLIYSFDFDDELNIGKCIETRQKSKNFTEDQKIQEDKLMVRESVYPFYKECLDHMKFDQIISVMNNKERRDIKDLLNEIIINLD